MVLARSGGTRAGKHDDLVFALGIALWRANGDARGTGIIEYYRCEGAGYNWGLAEPEAASFVRLKVPGLCSHIIVPPGATLAVPEDRRIEVGEEDAGPLVAAGSGVLG
jgi:hypothetical protein